MKQRGRKSGASLTVVAASAVEAIERPQPPPYLTDEQRIEWVRVVNDMAAEWFSDSTEAILAQYCRHAVSANRIATMIEGLDDMEDPLLAAQAFDKLLGMQERESRILVSLATKMRLTQQSTYSDQKQKRGGGSGKKLWES